MKEDLLVKDAASSMNIRETYVWRQSGCLGRICLPAFREKRTGILQI